MTRARRILPPLLVLAGSLLAAPARAQDDEGESKQQLPIVQYTIAVVFISAGAWSVLRSSRRGWA